MTNTFKKSFLFLLTCLLATNLWADTEKNPTSGLSADSRINGISYTINGAYIAGEGGSKKDPMTGKGVKFRINKNISGISNAIEFTVNNGYTITSIDFCGITNDNSKTADLAAVYIDGTSDNNKLSSIPTVTLPNKSASAAASFTITGFAANSKVIVAFTSNSLPSQANIEYTITYTAGDVPPAEPVAVTGVTLDKTTLSISQGKTAQLKATVQPANADNKKVSWTSSNPAVATVDSLGKVTAVAEGTATITVTTEDGNHTATCVVTVTPPAAPVPATGITLAPTTLTVKVGATGSLLATVAPADADDKTVTWTSSDEAIATVTPQATATGIVTGVTEGTATITASTVNGFTATCTVTVTTATPVPYTDLTLHVPEIYEGKSMAGGYNTPLVEYNQREYEVYYFGKAKPIGASSDIAVTYTLNHKGGYLVSSTSGSGTSMTAQDGWFKAAISSLEGSFKDAGSVETKADAREEFDGLPGDLKLKNNNSFELHIQGYDQFTIVAQDKKKDTKGTNPADNRYWEVYIDSILQPQQFNKDNATTRRYDMTTGKHVIYVKAIGGEDSKLYGFSLRVAEEPRTKYFKGNDTTQVILQTQAPLPVYYITKYYKKGLPEILWDGNAAEGISLKQKAQSDLRDTSYISGVANCPVGEYKYYIVTKMNGVETSRSQQGKFSVIRKVEFKNKRDTFCFVNQETALTPIVIRYYSNDDEAISLEWTSATQPAESEISVKQDKDANTLTISGTPTKPADYSYVVRLTDAEPIKGIIRVKNNKPTNVGADKTMLFLTRTEDEQPTGMGSYLDTKYNYLHRAAASKTGSVDSYKAYNFVVISENVDADNAEALALIRGEVNIPVLNMKAFTYAPERVSKDGWGEPDNGTLKKEDGVYITVQRDDHPIFKALGKKQGDKIQVLDSINQKGLMPININNCDGSLALATAYPRDINQYYESAAYPQTIIHEIPAGSALRNGNSNKYICFPIASSSSNILTADGKKLLTQIIDYLTTAGQTAISTPELKITSFSIDGVAAKIGEDQIVLELDTVAHKIDLAKAKPAIQVASPYTHAEPLDGEEVNFKNSVWAPVVYTVTDYINRRTYDVIVRAYNPQGIEETYVSGEWVNIYDIYGRLIATTNEDIYQIDLPRGMYIVVTANGGTLKIMK